MAFHDTRLPEDVERGATGGPRFKTTIFELSSGHEQRNIDWSQTRGKWVIGYGIETKEEFSLLLSFFYARQGRAHSFRFKDWSDYEMTDQVLGQTDTSTSTFALFRTYTDGGISFNRLISKPVNGTVVAKVNGVEQTVVYNTAPSSTQVAIDTTTGEVTIGSTHAATTGTDVSVTLEFDAVCRFDTDQFGITLAVFNAGSIPNLPIIEVRDT